jgi:hypothetical protein
MMQNVSDLCSGPRALNTLADQKGEKPCWKRKPIYCFLLLGNGDTSPDTTRQITSSAARRAGYTTHDTMTKKYC